MSNAFSPELNQLIQLQMASGKYESEDDLLVDAIHALNELRDRHAALRGEIQSRVEKAGTGNSKPLDRDAFKTVARRRLAEEG